MVFFTDISAATPFFPIVVSRKTKQVDIFVSAAYSHPPPPPPPPPRYTPLPRTYIYACSAQGPTAPGVTEGRSLPGDSTLVCAAYHQFPLILNRIQRTKPAPRRSADVYIGITGNVYTRTHAYTRIYIYTPPPSPPVYIY